MSNEIHEAPNLITGFVIKSIIILEKHLHFSILIYLYLHIGFRNPYVKARCKIFGLKTHRLSISNFSQGNKHRTKQEMTYIVMVKYKKKQARVALGDIRKLQTTPCVKFCLHLREDSSLTSKEQKAVRGFAYLNKLPRALTPHNVFPFS